MQVTCQKCDARYLVKDYEIGPDGRKVKCARCGHIWHATAPETIPDIEAFERELQTLAPIPEGSALPVPHVAGTPSAAGLKVASLILLAATLVAGFIAQRDLLYPTSLRIFYDAFGLYDTRGVALKDVSIASMPERGKTEYFITGTISNEATEERIIPRLRVQVFDDQGRVIKNEDFEKDDTLAPDGNIPFKTKITVRAEALDRVVVDIGNVAQLRTREE